jgi:hypothetical protein
MSDGPDFSNIEDKDLAAYHAVLNVLRLGVQRELARRRRPLREGEERAARGWPEYRNAEELDRRDAEVGGASNDAFK